MVVHELWVWMNGEKVGAWSQGRTGRHRFIYDDDWIASARVRSLSLSLPISPGNAVEGAAVSHYFENLLPDSEPIRKRLKDRYRTRSTEAFELLQAIGRDCVGAVQLLPPGQAPTGFDSLSYDILDETAIAQRLRQATLEPGSISLGEDDELRLSIAGAQEKTALLRLGQQWCLPRGATPTTHILKLPMGLVGGRQLDLSHSVENEWLCAQLMEALGLPVAHTEMASFAGQKALVVERFDRRFVANGQWIARLPQEDFCQVFGKSPNDKYEAHGGPGLADCLKVLANSEDAPHDRLTFLCAQLAFWLLAATDGHAKNFSLSLLQGDRYRLTPLYDVLSAWPIIGNGPRHVAWKKAKLAMAVRTRNTHYKLAEIQTRHWHQLACRSGVEGAWDAMLALVERVQPALLQVESLLPANYPAATAEAIFTGLRQQAAAFREGLAALALKTS